MQRTMIGHYVYGLSQGYLLFSGRARRQEYWSFFLVNFIVSIVLYAIEKSVLDDASWLTTLYFVVTLLPNIAVAIRRLHDTDRTGWWYLIVLIPIAGFVALVVFCALDGQRGENRFGADPKTDIASDPGAPAA